MIALVISLVLIAYVLLPGVLLRVAFSVFFIPFKRLQRSRSEEFVFSVAIALLPFLLAGVLCLEVPWMRHNPRPVLRDEWGKSVSDSRDLVVADYETAFLTAYSYDEFKLSEGTVNSSTGSLTDQRLKIWSALWRSVARVLPFTFWFYMLLTLEIAGVFKMGRDYWRYPEQSLRKRMFRKLVIPNISEWPGLFEGFLAFPRSAGTFARVDILTDGDKLYSGRVDDYMTGQNGELTGVLLADARRYDRKKLEVDRSNNFKKDLDAYWRDIPNVAFYQPANKILNINFSYDFKNPAKALEALAYLQVHDQLEPSDEADSSID